MRIQDEHRTGIDRRHFDSIAMSPFGIDRRWTTDQRSHLVDELEIYGHEKAKPESYWETLFNIPSEDSR